MKYVSISLLVLLVASLSACGSSSCRQKDPYCLGEEVVSCVDGKPKRMLCGQDSYCNYGQCTALAFGLPEDAAPHQQPTEWWYYTGHLAADSSKWGFQVTIFQYDLDGYFGYMCHVALIDELNLEHYHTEGITLTPNLWTDAEISVLGCHINIGPDGLDHIVGLIPEGKETDGHPGQWRLELSFEPQKRHVPHGSDGIIPMGVAGGASYYYSYTRLQASGTLLTPDTGSLAVVGQAWMDHQWGEFDIVEFKGWDWWSMQLDDGYEIMLFTFRDWEGVLVSQAGTIVDPDGMLTALEGLEDFTITPRRTWSSPHTDGQYPLDWDIHIVPGDWKLQVITSFDDQEMHNIAQNYWEGSTTISGTRADTDVRGMGFTELTGYASDLLDP